jgi:hypothetical protein
MSIVLQLNSVNAESATGIRFLANIIDRGDAVIPAYSTGVTDKSVTIWLDKATKDGQPFGTKVADRIANRGQQVYHLTVSDFRLELTDPTAGSAEKGNSHRVFQSLEVKPVGGAKVSGQLQDRLVLEVGDL